MSWFDCKVEVKGFKGAKFKVFWTRVDVERDILNKF